MKEKLKFLLALCLSVSIFISLFQIGTLVYATDVNIALNKQYTSSGVESGMTNVGPENAFDGSTSTRFSAPKMKNFSDNVQREQWLQVDLGRDAVINSIKIAFYLKVFSTEYEIHTSNNATDWVLLHRQTHENSENRDIIDTLPFSERAVSRYLRFTFKKVNESAGGHSVSVRDIEIMGRLADAPPSSSEGTDSSTPTESDSSNTASTGSPIISTNKLYTASAVESVGGESVTPDKAFDRDNNTRFSSGRVRETNRQAPQWLQVDMGQRSRVDKIVVDFYLLVYATEYSIETSNWGEDGTWQEVHVERNPDGTTRNLSNTIIFAEPKNLERYVRFHFKSLNSRAAGVTVSVRDIAIHGELLGVAINPRTKLDSATLTIRDNRVVLDNIEEDELYNYEIIGSDNKYVVSDNGGISSHRLLTQDVVLLVAAKDKSSGKIVAQTKMNKTITIPSTENELLQARVNTKAKPRLIPEIQEYIPLADEIDISSFTTIKVDENLRKYTDLFIADFKTYLKQELTYSDTGKIEFILDTENLYDLQEEGYLIKVDDTIRVYVKNQRAINHAAVTLTQLAMQSKTLSKAVIKDYPHFAIRGMVIDAPRMPMRVEFLENLGRLFRWYKLNEFHLDINNNQWPGNNKTESNFENWKNHADVVHRLESKKFPSLNKMPFKTNRFAGEYDFYNNEFQNPTYSYEEFRALQTKLNDMGLDVLVELNSPGHAAAYSVYAKVNPDNIDYLGDFINHPNDMELLAINETQYPTRARAARRFIEELVSEYLDANLFTYDHIHLGADEYWFRNGNIESFRSYLNFLHSLAESRGKKMRSWGALNHFRGTTALSKDIIFDEWSQSESNSIDRINEGFKVVNVPQPFTYITPGRNHKDMINSQYVYENWDAYMFNHNNRAMRGEPNFLGAKGAMWGDEHREGIEENDLYTRIEHSLSMIGLKTWKDTSPQERDFLAYQKLYETTRLKKNYLPQNNTDEVLVDLKTQKGTLYNLGTLPLEITNHGVVLDDENGLEFNGTNYLETNIDRIKLPYTLEMDVEITDNQVGTLLKGSYSELFLNKMARKQDATSATGFGLSRYFYTQNISDVLPVGEARLRLEATQQVLNVYLNDTLINTLSHRESINHGTTGNFRTSFLLPFKYIGKGFKGKIKRLKLYDKILDGHDMTKVNLALHKPVFAFRNNSRHNEAFIKPYNKDRVTDGELTSDEGYFKTSDRANDYLIIDLEKTMDVDEVEVIFKEGLTTTNFTKTYSSDMINWQEASRNVRYVKISIGEGNKGVREVRVYKRLNKGERDALLEALATKEVDYSSEDYQEVYRTLNNPFAYTFINFADKIAGFRNKADVSDSEDNASNETEGTSDTDSNTADNTNTDSNADTNNTDAGTDDSSASNPADTEREVDVTPIRKVDAETTATAEYTNTTFNENVHFNITKIAPLVMERLKDKLITTYDIFFTNDAGVKIQPKENQMVKISLPLLSGEKLEGVYHEEENVSLPFKVIKDRNLVEFDAREFSRYTLVYSKKVDNIKPNKDTMLLDTNKSFDDLLAEITLGNKVTNKEQSSKEKDHLPKTNANKTMPIYLIIFLALTSSVVLNKLSFKNKV